MKRLALGLVILLIGGAVAVVIVRAQATGGPIYSVSQLDARLRHDPVSVVGHVVAARGAVTGRIPCSASGRARIGDQAPPARAMRARS